MLVLGLAAGTVLGACVGGGSLPVTHYYTLRPAAEAEPPETVGAPGLVVGVRSFTVDPPYDQDRLVYRNGSESTEVRFYAYHRWAAPLGRLIAVALADGLSGTGGIATIEPARALVDYSAFLDGRLIYLEEVDSPGREEARMALELVLKDAAARVIWQSTLTGSATGSPGDVPGVMALIRQAFDDVTDAAASEISATLRARATAGTP
jgi:uncharacterized lipoprotein YmbA